MKKYITLTDKEIDLDVLSGEERLYLGEIVGDFENPETLYLNLFNKIHEPRSMALKGKGWIDKKVLESPLYQVCIDLADRLGIAQGYLRSDEKPKTHESDERLIGVKRAAEIRGVSRQAIQKAIRVGRLPAIRVGKSYVIKEEDLSKHTSRRSL